MAHSHPFYVWSGLLDPKHKKKIGSAIWEFLWCINRITKEIKNNDGTWGLVLGGKPIKAKEIEDDLGSHPQSIKESLRKLEASGYIKTIRTPHGQVIHVNKSKRCSQKATSQKKEELVDNSKKCLKEIEPNGYISKEKTTSLCKRCSQKTTCNKINHTGDKPINDKAGMRPVKTSVDNSVKKISQLIKGYENHIKKDTAVLVDRFLDNGFSDEVEVWAYIVQARGKRNPPGYLVKIIADPKYRVADSAREQAKREMRECGR